MMAFGSNLPDLVVVAEAPALKVPTLQIVWETLQTVRLQGGVDFRPPGKPLVLIQLV